MEEMVTDGVYLGAKDHDHLGGDFLKDLGFPDTVCDLVRGHVQAKRYLVWKNPEYYKSKFKNYNVCVILCIVMLLSNVLIV